MAKRPTQLNIGFIGPGRWTWQIFTRSAFVHALSHYSSRSRAKLAAIKWAEQMLADDIELVETETSHGKDEKQAAKTDQNDNDHH